MTVLTLSLKLIIFLISFVSLVNKTELLKGKFKGNVFLFFTNLSVLLCMLFYLVDICNYIALKKGFPFLANVKGAIVLYTLVTLIIYNLVLVPKHKNTGISHEFYSVQDTMIHCILPLLVLVEWLIAPKGTISVNAPVAWLMVPLLYFCLIELKGKFKLGTQFEYANSYYPYFFVDIEQVGLSKVIRNVLVFLLIFLCLGYLIFAVDHLLS